MEKKKKCITLLGIYIVLVVGIGLLLSPLLESAVVETISNRYLLHNYTADQIAGNIVQAQLEETVVEEDIAIQDLSSILPYILDIKEEQVIGAIAIPSVEMYLPIFNGTTKTNLIAGVGTMKDLQVMGQGNYCLAGHHMRDESLLFGPLNKVQIGDWIQLTDKTKLYTYEVTGIEIVHQDMVEVLEDTKSSTITLITCQESGVNTNYRLMIRGALLDDSLIKEETVYKNVNKESEQNKEESVNEYQEAFYNLIENSNTTGMNQLNIWIAVVAVLAAILLWTGNRILRTIDSSDNKKR